MHIKPIHSDDDLAAALVRMEQLWGTERGTAEGDELEVLAVLIEKYEEEHYPLPPSDPIEAIKFRMDQQGLTARDLEPYIGSSGRVSEVLNRKRKLSLAIIKRLHDGLRIPYEVSWQALPDNKPGKSATPGRLSALPRCGSW